MLEQTITLALASMLQFGTPILIAALGGVITETSGVVNLALEGLMRMGGFFAIVGAYFSGDPWIGLLAGIVIGVIMGLLQAYICVTWRGDQIIYGVAINIFALGGMTYLLERIFNTTGHSAQRKKTMGLASSGWHRRYPLGAFVVLHPNLNQYCLGRFQ
jgi:ABC-type uncharacterized transport system permease subunit